MGELIKVHPRLILPTQPILNKERFTRALKEYAKGGVEKFSPCPCTFTPKANHYLTLDGHSRITIATLVNEELSVYVPKNDEDLMKRVDFPKVPYNAITDMNYLITQRYESISRGLGITARVYGIECAVNLSFADFISYNRKTINRCWKSVLGTKAPA